MEDMGKDKNIELIEFLNQEKLQKKIHNKKIFTFYNKCLIKCIFNLNNKFDNIDNKNLCLINGINMIYYIFYVLIFYTNNIKLTIFLLERSILFYSEFIIMSQDKKLIDQICFIPNINDALFFTYKKTIGPIELCKIKVKQDQICIRDISRIMNIIYREAVVKKNNLLNDLNSINVNLSEKIYSVFFYIEDSTKKKELYNFVNDIYSKNLSYEEKNNNLNLFLSEILKTKKENINLEEIYNNINLKLEDTLLNEEKINKCSQTISL